MYAQWRNWGAPNSMLVRNPMYTYDDHDLVQGPGFYHMRRKVSSSEPPYPQTTHKAGHKVQADDKPRKGGLKDLDSTIGRFSTEVTSAHGIAHIYNSSSIWARMIWTIIVLTSAGALIYQMKGLITTFIQFGTNTEVTIQSRAQLEFPAITVCNTNILRRSAVAQTVHKPVLYVDDLTPLPYYIPCQADDFECGNGNLCVRSYLKCDGVNHCGDFSDENDDGCTYGNCGGGQFKCYNGSAAGYCIPDKLKCDGFKECYDGEDEWDCDCRVSEYKCTRRGGCIRRLLVCDGYNDCNDGTDEDGCDFEMDEDCTGGYACQDTYPTKCIPLKFLCDGFSDCPENDDEDKISGVCNMKPTAEPEPCTTEQFDCGNGQCLQPHMRCDSFIDCSNNMDEIGCGRVRCEDDFKKCTNDWQCVHEEEVCNFEDTCEGDDPDDEKNCTCVGEVDEGVPLFSVNCAGKLANVAASVDGVPVYIKCYGAKPEFAEYIHHRRFECTAQLTCADKQNLMPQTCTSVYTDCHVNTEGEDYKGRASQTTDGTACVKWTSDLPVAYGFTSTNYPLLGDHKYCRNPDSRGGVDGGPWCFIEEAGDPITGGEPFPGEGVHWKYCNYPADKRQSTCHEGITLNVRLVGDADVKRVEVERNGVWGTVQDSNWDINDGRVICSMLGQGSATTVQSSGVPATSGPVHISFVDCKGPETTLLDCVFKLPASGAVVDHTADVGVQCSGGSGSSGRRRKRDVENESEKAVHPGRKRREAEREHLHSLRRKKRQLTNEEQYNFPEDIEFEGTKLAALIDLDKDVFKCPSSDRELPLWQICNNYPDCPDGADEIYCTSRLCELGQRPCRLEDQCIFSSQECDEFPDCKTHGFDERLCMNITTCPEGYWKCPGRPVCIPLYYRCDTVDDCGLINEEGLPGDEIDCTDHPVPPPADPFIDDSWYEPYLDLLSDSAVFDDFASNYYRYNAFNRVKGENPVDWKSFFTFSSYPDYQDLLNVLYLDREEIQKLGHQFDDFVLECTYDEKPCTKENFTQFETDEYGNCFTFNFNPSGQDTYTTKAGPTYGLRMILNLQQDDYISLTGPEAGVRVTITPRDVRPLPAQNGITIRPGVVTSIGLRYENISRLGGRYGDCYPEDQTYKIIDKGEIRFSGTEAYDRQVGTYDWVGEVGQQMA